MLLVHFLMVLGSGMAMRPENSQGAEVMHSVVVQGTPHRIVASLLNQTTRADPRLALVGQSLAQMLDGNPNPEGEFNSLTDSLRDVLNKLLDEAKAAAGLAQANAQKEADSFEDCHSMDPHFQNFDDELQEHVQCRQAASALKTTADACNSEKAALKGTMEIACQAYDDYKAADHSCPARYSGESIEEWLLKAKNQFATRYDDYLDKKKACDDATADHDVVDCTSKNSAYEAKEGECDALYITLETHSCDHATVASQLADQYETCYEDKKNEYLEREAEMELETQRKLNSRLSMRILCLLDSVQEDADSKAFTIKEDAFEVCADKPEYDTDHLEVDWPPLPDESPPVVPSAYPCNTAYDEKVRAKLPTFADVPVCTECPGVSKGELPPYVTSTCDDKGGKWYLFGDISSTSSDFTAAEFANSATTSGATNGDSVQVGTFNSGSPGSPGFSFDLEKLAPRVKDGQFDLMIQYGGSDVYEKCISGFSMTDGHFLNNEHLYGRVGEHGMWGRISDKIDGYYATFCAVAGGCGQTGKDFWGFSTNGVYPSSAGVVPCGFHYSGWAPCPSGDNEQRMRYYVRFPSQAHKNSQGALPPSVTSTCDGKGGKWYLFGDISSTSSDFTAADVDNSATTSGMTNGDSVQVGTFNSGSPGSPGFSFDIGELAPRVTDGKFDLMIQYGDSDVYEKCISGFSMTDGQFINLKHVYGKVGEHGMWGSSSDQIDGYYATFCAVAGGCGQTGKDFWGFSTNGVYPSSAGVVPCGFHYSGWAACPSGDNKQRMRYYVRFAE